MAKKVFISQPMRDKTNEEIKKDRDVAIERVKEILGDDVEIIESFFEGVPHDAKPLWYLGESLKFLSTADVVYFVDGWQTARGCNIEFMCANQYGIAIMHN